MNKDSMNAASKQQHLCHLQRLHFQLHFAIFFAILLAILFAIITLPQTNSLDKPQHLHILFRNSA